MTSAPGDDGDVDLMGTQAEDMDEEDDQARTQPLLDSVRSLVNKERQLAGLQLEEKAREAELWQKKYLELQTKTGVDPAADGQCVYPGRTLTGSTPWSGPEDDWDNLQAASKIASDPYLRKLRKQEHLDLSRRGIGKHDLEGIAMKLRWLRGFTSVDLSSNNVDDACVQPLKSLLALRQLRRLDLSGNDLGPSAGKALFESLSRCKDIQVLRLESNVRFARVPGAGALIAGCLRAAVKAGGCRHLWSLSVTLDDFDSTFFMNAPRKMEKPSRLATPGRAQGSSKAVAPPAPARQTPAHPMNALALARAFHPRAPGGGAGPVLDGGSGHGEASNGGSAMIGTLATGSGRGSITSLGLPYARLHLRTVEGLATHATPSLTHLDLSFCYVGAAGASALALALDGSAVHGVEPTSGAGKGSYMRGRGSRSLRSLKLPHNSVGDTGARALGRALSSNRCLTDLSLASNGIGFAGGRALAAALVCRDGGGGRRALLRLDVGDNPLGEKAVQLLVAAASSAGDCGAGDDDAVAAVQIVGLDRVAGATVTTREAARCIGAANEGLVPGKDGVGLAVSRTLVAIDEEVAVRSEDVKGEDGLVQVYQVQLHFRFETPADDIAKDMSGWRARNSTLDLQWNFASNISTCDPCEWRVIRLRVGEPEFTVKEGIGTEPGLAAGQTHSDGAEPREGYSRVRLTCNGWRKDDVLKILVRIPHGAWRINCRDLSISLAGNASPSSSSSPSPYGLLWTDPVDAENLGGWREEDRPLSPSVAECARVAFQMSRNNKGPRPSAETDFASAVYRLRQVHVAHGGRIRASWQAMLAVAPLQRFGHQVVTGDCNKSERRQRCEGYSWAIVRTRGTVGEDSGGGTGPINWAGRVVQQGVVADSTAVAPSTSSGGRATGREEEGNDNGKIKADIDPSAQAVSPTKSPWRWHSIDADSSFWLPGDVLSLWIRLDITPTLNPPSIPIADAWGSETSAVEQRIGVNLRRTFPHGYHLLVRGFELGVVDDARAEEIARRSMSSLLHDGNGRPRAIGRSTGVAGGTAKEGASEAGGTMAECFYAPRSSGAALRPDISVAPTVQLNFAAVYPMNMAAAGSSWA